MKINMATKNKKENKDDIKRSLANSKYQEEELADTEMAEELAEEIEDGNQTQGLLGSYGADDAKKKRVDKLDRDY
jgi:hypothetical protein